MTYHWGFDTVGFGIVAVVGVIAMIAFWSLIILGLFFGVRWLIRADRDSRLPGPSSGSSPDDPLEILRQRYARGEIDDEEFERRKRTLTGG